MEAAAVIRHKGVGALARGPIGYSIRRAALATKAAPTCNKISASMLLGAALMLAWIGCHNDRLVPTRSEPSRNETILFQQPPADPDQAEAKEFSKAEDEPEDIGTEYTRTVQTVRFFNPGAPENAAGDSERFAQPKSAIRNASVSKPAYAGEGIASWYGPDFHGHKTANGERYNMNGISAAHRTMPLPSYARVTNLDNGRSIIVRVNNRGPYVHRRIVDVSVGAAKALDFYKKGTTHVRVEFVSRAPVEGSDDRMLLATLRTGAPAPTPSELMLASANSFSLPSAPAGIGDEKADSNEH